MPRVRISIEGLDPQALEEQYSILGARTVKRDSSTIILEKPGMWRIVYDGKTLVAETDRLSRDQLVEEAIDALKLLFRYKYCAGCRACEPNCPTTAMRVTDKPRADPDKCIACRICIDTCTIAEVYVEHIIVPLLLNKPLAWRRPTKRKIEDTLEKEKTLLVQAKPVNEIREKQDKHEINIPSTLFTTE